MTYKSDFENDTGWSVVDTNIKLNGPNASSFRSHLKDNGIHTIIRYYASSRRSKTLSLPEAKLLSSEGFNILPVYQDRNRLPEDFGAANGRSSARNALDFVRDIGQPEGSTIFFAVDADFSRSETDQHIIPYFSAIKSEIGSVFRIGAYGSGLVLSSLMDEGLIEIPWISMSRAFHGTKDYFYSSSWILRQVPPPRTHSGSGVTHDRNVLSRPVSDLGAFRLDSNGVGHVVGGVADRHPPGGETDATLGGGLFVEPEARLEGVNAYVTTEGLNFRREPNGEIIRVLTIGDPVKDRGPADENNWRRVEIDGEQGVVFGKYLRNPGTTEIESLLRSTIDEWIRFNKGHAQETSDPFYKFVGEMWASIGESYDGRSRYPDGREVPWSAAFISFVVRRAGTAYARFKFSASHSEFSHDAIQARFMSSTDRPFWGFRQSEERPEIGDIIHRNRGRGTFTFDFAENHSQFRSHSDIVVEVTPQVARVIGGNVSDTVSMAGTIQEYELDSSGYLKSGQRVIALLKNRASQVA